MCNRCKPHCTCSGDLTSRSLVVFVSRALSAGSLRHRLLGARNVRNVALSAQAMARTSFATHREPAVESARPGEPALVKNIQFRPPRHRVKPCFSCFSEHAARRDGAYLASPHSSVAAGVPAGSPPSAPMEPRRRQLSRSCSSVVSASRALRSPLPSGQARQSDHVGLRHNSFAGQARRVTVELRVPASGAAGPPLNAVG